MTIHQLKNLGELKMIAPTNIFELQKLKQQYNKLSSFIRSLDVHFRFTPNTTHNDILVEIINMQKRIDKIIIEMDAFEQSELGEK